MEHSYLCRKPDSKGVFNRRCCRIIKPCGEEQERQCRAAAVRGTRLCNTHGGDASKERDLAWRFSIARVAVVALACCFCAACDEDGAKRALSDEGFTAIVMQGPGFIGCGRDDSVVNKFEATSVTGARVNGVVCSGLWWKGYTVRLMGRVS